MSTMTRLEPPIPLDTPRGKAEAYFVWTIQPMEI